MLNLVLAKQWRGETKSDQYWGAQLAAKGGTYECYMPPAQVRAAKQAREREEAELRSLIGTTSSSGFLRIPSKSVNDGSGTIVFFRIPSKSFEIY